MTLLGSSETLLDDAGTLLQASGHFWVALNGEGMSLKAERNSDDHGKATAISIATRNNAFLHTRRPAAAAQGRIIQDRGRRPTPLSLS